MCCTNSNLIFVGAVLGAISMSEGGVEDGISMREKGGQRTAVCFCMIWVNCGGVLFRVWDGLRHHDDDDDDDTDGSFNMGWS